MNFNVLLASALVSILVMEIYAKEASASSEEKQEVAPVKPDVPNQKTDVIKEEKSGDEQNIVLTNATVLNTIALTTTTTTKSPISRHVPKRCRQHPETCQKGMRSERLATRERKREEKRRIKEEKKKQKEHKRAEKMAGKDKYRKDKRLKKDHKPGHFKMEVDQHNAWKAPHKHNRPSVKKELSSKQDMGSKSNGSYTIPPPQKDQLNEDADLYYYDYDDDKSTESETKSGNTFNIEKRSQLHDGRRVRTSCDSDDDCASDQCCTTRVTGDKVCSKKNYMREGRRCVNTCTCHGDMQCYRPDIRNARTGELTPRRERIGRCTSQKEVDVNIGVVLPRPNKSTN